MHPFKSVCILLACTATASAAPPLPRQDDAHYESAIRFQSTSHGYVLVTVVDGNTGAVRRTCTTANLLLGAIYFENEFEDDDEGREMVKRIALLNKEHIFTFTKRKALDNIPRYFTEGDLAQVRKATAGMTPQQAMAALHGPGPLGSLKLSQDNSWGLPANLGAAVACAFVERGFSAIDTDMNGLMIEGNHASSPAAPLALTPASPRASSSP